MFIYFVNLKASNDETWNIYISLRRINVYDDGKKEYYLSILIEQQKGDIRIYHSDWAN
jgi:hypothetical protein